jgi:hypothetical protein
MPHGPWPHLLLGPDPDRITNQIINRKVFHSFFSKKEYIPNGIPGICCEFILIGELTHAMFPPKFLSWLLFFFIFRTLCEF